MIDDDHPALRLPNKLRPLPEHIKPGSFILPVDVIRRLGGGHVGLGEAIASAMFDLDAVSGRIVPPGSVRDVGHGDPVAGRKVLAKFVERIRQGNKAERSDDVLDLRRLSPYQLAQLGGVHNITHADDQ